jgi:hypothetical protein
MLLLTAGRSSGGGAAVRAPRVIQHAATRMPRGTDAAATVGSSANGQALHALISANKTPHSREQPDSERSSVAGLDAVDAHNSSSSASGSRRTAAEREAQLQELVPMTPLIVPGAAGDEPVMTWGQIQVLLSVITLVFFVHA